MKLGPIQPTVIIALSLLSHISLSQNTFEYRVHDSADNLTNAVVETNSGQFIISAVKLNEQHQGDVCLIKLNSVGTLLDTIIFDYQGHNCGFHQILQIDPNQFLLTGYVQYEGIFKLWFWKMDSLFNEIQNKVIPLGIYSYANAQLKRDHDGNILCFGCITDSLGHRNAFIYKLTPTGDSLRFKVFTSSHAFGKFDLLEKPGDQGYIYDVNGFTPGGNILDLDTMFSIRETHYVPNDIYNFTDLRWVSPGSFYLTGEKLIMPAAYRKIGVEILDTNYSVIHARFLGDSDTTIYFPGLQKNLDFVYLNTTYIGGTSDFYPEEFAPVDCWYFLTCVDTTLSIKWQKFYGGDANYTLYGVLATKDEGCLMFGTLYDKDPLRLKRDIYVLKVNKDGLLVSTNGTPSPKVKEVILFPNPGSDKLHVLTSLKNLTLILFDINGNCILEDQISDNNTILDVSRIPSGMFLYRFTKDGNTVDSGKWIKK